MQDAGLSVDRFQAYVDTAVELGLQYAPKLILAILVLVIGIWIVNRLVAGVTRTMDARGVEPTLARFLRSLTNIFLKALLFISAASMIGIETTSFIAVLGAAGLAIGLALQGSLANFAGGVLILMFRPYRVGDTISAQSQTGTVSRIDIFNTVLKTPDNKTIIIPNGMISNGIITNISAEATRRVDFVFGIGYDDDIAKAKDVLNRLISGDNRILDNGKTQVVVSELADSSVNITVRVWVNAPDYWEVFFGMTERVKIAFDAEGISIPYPQRDIHMTNQNA